VYCGMGFLNLGGNGLFERAVKLHRQRNLLSTTNFIALLSNMLITFCTKCLRFTHLFAHVGLTVSAFLPAARK
jgi:hypothetical protein